MNTRIDHDLFKAWAILRGLQRVELRNDGDRRFVETWRSYLDHAGDSARSGRYQLAMLRRVAAAYGLCEEGKGVQAGGLD